MRVYFDSSAFAKRYIDEAGTAEVLEWCDRATELAFSVIAVPELASAFRRLLREGRLELFYSCIFLPPPLFCLLSRHQQ